MKAKTQLIRNSTAEFLIFTGQAGEQSIEARYADETIWLSQKLMATLFDVGVNTVNYHLKEVYENGEIQPEATIRKFRRVQQEGFRQVTREVDFSNLDAIISVGYRVNDLSLNPGALPWVGNGKTGTVPQGRPRWSFKKISMVLKHPPTTRAAS